MSVSVRKIKEKEFPPLLREIPDPPNELYIKGHLPAPDLIPLCVVGSRKFSDYGKGACERIIGGLKGLPFVIVSGLALGIDSIAHKTALKNNIKTIAVPGSGLNDEVLYPKSHLFLARDILSSSGALLSEYPPSFSATTWSFPKRNRIMAGMSRVILVIEAGEMSGTLITARLGLEYNREVCTVPGSIFSSSSSGSNQLIKEGAYPITSSDDICEICGIEKEKKMLNMNLSEKEKNIINMIKEPKSKEEVMKKFGMSINEIQILISAMEMKGLINEVAGKICINDNIDIQ